MFEVTNTGGLVSFEAFARAVSVLQKGTPEERLLFCLSLFKSAATAQVDASGALTALRAMYALYGCTVDHAELQRLAGSVVPGKRTIVFILFPLFFFHLLCFWEQEFATLSASNCFKPVLSKATDCRKTPRAKSEILKL